MGANTSNAAGTPVDTCGGGATPVAASRTAAANAVVAAEPYCTGVVTVSARWNAHHTSAATHAAANCSAGTGRSGTANRAANARSTPAQACGEVVGAPKRVANSTPQCRPGVHGYAHRCGIVGAGSSAWNGASGSLRTVPGMSDEMAPTEGASGTSSDTASWVADAGRLYILSGMVDVLRDLTGSYLTQDIDPGRAAVDQILTQYTYLQTELPGALSPAGADALTRWAVEVPDTATLAHIHLTLAAVARFIDVLLQAPQFSTQRRLLIAASDQANRQLDDNDVSILAGAGLGPVHGPSNSGSQAGGMYL